MAITVWYPSSTSASLSLASPTWLATASYAPFLPLNCKYLHLCGQGVISSDPRARQALEGSRHMPCSLCSERC